MSDFFDAYRHHEREVNTLNNDRGPYLTIQEVAARYRLHPETVRRWINEGRLPALKLAGGSAWRIRERDLSSIEHETHH